MAEEIRWQHQAQEERDAVLSAARNGALDVGSRVQDTLLWQEEEIRRLKSMVLGDLHQHDDLASIYAKDLASSYADDVASLYAKDLVSSYAKEIERSMAGDFGAVKQTVPPLVWCLLLERAHAKQAQLAREVANLRLPSGHLSSAVKKAVQSLSELSAALEKTHE